MEAKPQNPIITLLLTTSAFILAVHPLTWLLTSWFEPSYASDGGFIFLVLLGSFLWSISSPRSSHGTSHQSQRLAYLLIGSTAIIRLFGSILAINFLSALTLVVDVYAIGLLFGLHTRQRSLSPGWLAFAFLFTLPMERIIQRTIGFGLQHVSAWTSEQVLALGFGDVERFGTRILVEGQDVLIDLPCSGARGLLHLTVFLAVTAAFAKPSWRMGLIGLFTTTLSALGSNTLRIVILAIFLARPEWIGFRDVMAAPWHDVIGLIALASGILPILRWARKASDTGPNSQPSVSLVPAPPKNIRPKFALLMMIAAALVVVVPARPLDVSKPIDQLELPRFLAGHYAQSLPIEEQESRYYQQYGGGAAKAQFGPNTLLLVKTSSPLRHLHAPNECLKGGGHQVEFLGISHDEFPSAIFKSIAPDGSVYRIAVSYLDDNGLVATSVSEVVWNWLKNPKSTWTAIERISPWDSDLLEQSYFDEALASYFELTTEEYRDDLETFHMQSTQYNEFELLMENDEGMTL